MPDSDPPTTDTKLDKVASAVIRSASRTERALSSEAGYIGRAGLRPDQTVAVILSCPGIAAGEVIGIAALDGGEVTAATTPLCVAADGTASFTYRGATGPGSYRVMVYAGGTEQTLEFYVLDLGNPDKNPPQVRVVD